MATTQELLDEASAAYHKLQTGTMARVIVDIDGSRVEFTPANKQALYSYILQLQSQVGTVVPVNVAPAQFYF
jgi:predicted regulator of Ras-like GTPase activity (Roadblock/LC7/MglB family)